MTVLVAGSSNLDFVVRAAHIPSIGETVLGRDFKTYPGGKGANQAVACARAGGVKTRFLTAMGSDHNALPLEESLKRAGVQTDLIRTPHHPTGTAFICVDDEAQNAITVAPGANLQLAPQHMPALHGVSHLLMQLEVPMQTVDAFAAQAKREGVCVVLNAAPAAVLPKTLLSNVDVLLVNEGELRTIVEGAHCAAPQSIADCLAILKVPTVLVTLGHRGSCAWHQGRLHYQAAHHVHALDTTGAGDTFSGVLVAMLSLGNSLELAVHRASAASAIACTRAGAQSSIPLAHEVDEFLAQYKQAMASATDELRAYCGLS